jgi:hypothetical protein
MNDPLFRGVGAPLVAVKYLVGQRVIVNNDTIATVIDPPDKWRHDVWVRLPDGVTRYYSVDNVRPLPNGQL